MDSLNKIHSGFEYIDFSERDILRLQEMTMPFAGHKYGGQYKTDDNVILDIDVDGNRRVRFRLTSTDETLKAMEQLELAYMEACSDGESTFADSLRYFELFLHTPIPGRWCYNWGKIRETQ